MNGSMSPFTMMSSSAIFSLSITVPIYFLPPCGLLPCGNRRLQRVRFLPGLSESESGRGSKGREEHTVLGLGLIPS